MTARAWVATAPALAWAGVLFFLSSQSHLPVLSTVENFDKVEHLGAYGILGALVYGASIAWGSGPRAPAILWATALGSLYGITDEFHQSFVPNRSAEVADAVADALGACLGALGGWILLHLFRRMSR